MEKLWAPWRLDYITGKREEGCVFCKAPESADRFREQLLLHLGKQSFVIMNRYPYNSGHLMVIPRRHTNDFTSLTAAENAEMSLLLQVSLKALQQSYGPEGINIGLNLGHSAGAGIREHLHYHIVPRWIGDTNFFPVLANTRSIPELLEQSYDRLRPCFRTFERDGEISPGGHQEPESDS